MSRRAVGRSEDADGGGIPGSVIILLAVLVVVTAGLFWVSGAKRTVPPDGPQAGTVKPSFFAKPINATLSPKAQAEVERGTARVLLPDGTGALLPPELAESAKELNALTSTIQRDFEILDLLLDSFRKFNGGVNPQGGENDEIIAQLSGEKGKRLAVISPDHPFIDPAGRLVDRWGTPFYFHPVGHDTMDIRSAGPDRKLWTADDVIHGEVAPEGG